MKSKLIRNVVGILIVVAGGAAYYGFREYNRKHADAADAVPAYEVEASSLIREFTSGESDANHKYLGKVLSVSGTVKHVEAGGGGYIISLGDSLTNSSVRCTLDSLHSTDGADVKPWDATVIKGYCSGFNADELVGSDVILTRCVIIPTPIDKQK